MPLAGVAHGRAAGQAVGRLHADGADAALAELLGDLGEHRLVVALDDDVELERRVDLGQRAAGELDVDHRAGDADDPAVGAAAARSVAFSVMVIATSPVKAATSSSSRMRTAGASVAGAEGLGAADDLHDLGGDGVLAGAVHDPAERLDQLFGVVGGRLHRPLAEGVLGRRGVEQGGVDAGLDVARQQRLEDRRRVGLELVVAGGLVGGTRPCRRHRPRSRPTAARAAAARPPGCRRVTKRV